MARRCLAISVVCLLACAAVFAADFWEETAFNDWSDGDVEKMMSNSPWAKRITVVFPRPPREGARGGVAAGGGAGGGGGGRGGFGGGGQSRLVVRWQSALPVRQAQVRAQIERGATVPEGVLDVLNQPPPGYYVFVTGIPGQFAGLSSGELGAEARLERNGKPPILPVQAGPQREGRSLSLVYVFPKDDPIVLEDDEIEFVSKVGDTTIKRKFKLEEMVFNDRLEL